MNQCSTKRINDKETILKMIEEYRDGYPVHQLIQKYGYKTNKSLEDKVKKYYPNNYQEIFKQAKEARKGYNFSMATINSEFKAYFLSLMLSDGYVCGKNRVGIDLTDEDAIAFIAKEIGVTYKTYYDKRENRKPRHRFIISDSNLVEELARLGVVHQKSLILSPPDLTEEERVFIPYILRGFIDGDGGVSPTSVGGPQVYMYSASLPFLEWCKVELNTLGLTHVNIIKTRNKKSKKVGYADIWRLKVSQQDDIKLILSIIYDKPYGMSRKYIRLRETFRDYNSNTSINRG